MHLFHKWQKIGSVQDKVEVRYITEWGTERSKEFKPGHTCLYECFVCGKRKAKFIYYTGKEEKISVEYAENMCNIPMKESSTS